ncbi:MAG: DegV family protein [Gaiellaceae bacterium]
MKLGAANTAIVLDSTADYADEARHFPNWRVVPLYVRFGDESYRDYLDLGPDEFYARLRTAPVTPTTSQPTPGDFLATYEGLGGYERILSLHIGGRLSGTFQSATTAAEMLGGDRVRTIDTETASAAIAMLALAVQRRLEQRTTDEEIDELVEAYKRSQGLLFTVDTLEYLQRGGRIGRARALTGQLLNVKPILTIRDGEVVPVGRVRGSQKALGEIVARFERATRDEASLRIGIAHADAPGRAEALQELVRMRRPAAVLEVVTSLGAVIGAHAGPGTVGFFWFDDEG